MKRFSIFAFAALGWIALGAGSARAQGNVLKEARVTQVVKDVKLLPSAAAPRPAALSDTVRGDTAVRTGAESRAELTFSDLTIARLGANTIFSFNEGTRTIDLNNGAILLRVPKNSGGAKIQTAAVTAAITGTTVIVEYHKNSYAKYLVLEGTMRIYLKGVLGESVLLGPGQMMILNPNAKRLPEVVDYDVNRLLSTSLFIQGYPPLPSTPLLAETKQVQLEKKADGELIDTNLVIFGRGTLVTLTDPQSTDVIDRTNVFAPPGPTPSKIGRPPVIANSAGFMITGASRIQTDPSIASPGRVDFGKIYRGPGQDATFSTWSFDTTRPFDTSSGFDAFYGGAGVNIAAFKFQSLILAGNPLISTANGGATFLELIGVDGITSGPPGGALTFPGINNLLLAAQNGSIILGPEISFQNLPALFLYARGTNSNIVLGSQVIGTRDLFLEAEGSVQVNGAENVTNFRSVTGGDFLAGTGAVNATTIDIRSGGNLNFTLSQFAVGGTRGGTVTLNAGGAANLDARGDQTVFNNASSVAVTGQTINFLGNNPTTIDFSLARTASFNAGTGGFQGSTVAINGATLVNITSGANINLFRLVSGNNVNAATSISSTSDFSALTITAGTTINVGGILGNNFSRITAGQSITSGGDLNGALVQAGTSISVGGNFAAGAVNAGTDIRVTGNFSPLTGASAGGLIAVGGNVGTTGNITAGTTINVNGNFNAAIATAGQSITVGGNLTVNTSATAGTSINVNGDGTAAIVTAGQSVTIGRNLTVTTSATAGTSINVGGNVSTTGNITAGTTLNVNGDGRADIVTAGQGITVGGNLTTTTSTTAGSAISVGGTFRSPLATAGGDITANEITLLNATAAGVLRGGTITPFIPAAPANLLHSLTVSSIVSVGGINFNGDRFVAAGDGKDGGKLSIFANTITFDLANIASANFNGATGVPTNSAGGSGGQFTITSAGAITVNAPIQATTGINNTGVAFGGTGGTVSFTSTAGAVNVNSSILVSSNDADTVPQPFRRSAAGGTLSLTSGLTTGNAITLGGSAQLFSLLNAGAPGPAGQITISAAGGNIVDNGATIEADRGTITIQHTAAASTGTAQITLNGGAITSETLLASSRGGLIVGTTTAVNLNAVTISFLATGNLAWSGGTLNAAARASSGNVTLQSGGPLTIFNSTTIQRSNGGITDGLNIAVNAVQNFQANQALTLRTDGGGLTSGGNITLSSGGTFTIGGVGTFQTGPATVDQTAGSNISIQSTGAITAGDLVAAFQNGVGRTVTTGGNVTFGGNSSYLATQNDGGLDLRVNNSTPGKPNTGGFINVGGNITLTLNGNLATNPSGVLTLVINNQTAGITIGGNITGTIGGNLTTSGVNAQIDNRNRGFIGTGAGLTFTVNGTTTTAGSASFTLLNSQSGTPGGTIGSDAFIKLTLADTNIGANLNAFIDNTDGAIGGTGGMVTLQVNGKLAVTNRIDVFGTLTSTGTITAGEFSVTTTNAPGISVGAGGITRFNFTTEPGAPSLLHTITTNALTSTGGINFNGPDLTGGFGPYDGGQLTLNVPSLTFGPGAGNNIQGPVTFNGGGTTGGEAAGSGGIFNVNATGLISVGSSIQATTGFRRDSADPRFGGGNGGTVNLVSTGGAIGVSAAIKVSSADPAVGGAGAPPRRSSFSGGNINLRSDAATGVAINVTNTGQLLSLLEAVPASPPGGAGGKITILATGANSQITIAGAPPGVAAPPDSIRADRGSIDIRHTGDFGSIGLTNSNIAADIVKVGALGNNGTLTIGGGRINADTILKLYAPGSNGSITFIADVSLNGNSTKTLAAATITITDRVTVTIGGPNPAQVFTNRANYTGFGGNGSTSGTFAGAGANAPQPLANAPPFGPPGGP